ncbi:MFS transporter [Naasia aerilata]|uniref:MFS transporter n=1 Tax=Naasia aerilata TaxID=1162966 RepID=A0ABM8GE42_9MICO|nr:MFS transporter [Naasia aerilata]BDZ46540.1 MFS transporter [Naasia aerilata]
MSGAEVDDDSAERPRVPWGRTRATAPRVPISLPGTPRAFPLLWAGTGAANLADGIALSIGPLLAASLTRDPALVAGLVVAQRLPWLVFVLFSGVIVDRFDRRMLLVLGNLVRVLALGGVTVGLLAGVREIWMLYAAGFLLGMAETVVDNASLAILPQLATASRIPDANGRLFATQSLLNELVGPPIGALIFALSATASFASGSAAFLLAAVVFWMLPRSARSPEPDRTPVLEALANGVREFGRIPLLLLLSCTAAAMNFFSAASGSVLVLLAQDRLGLEPAGFGLLIATGAVGGVLGGLLGPALLRRLSNGLVIGIGTAVGGLAYMLMALTTSAWIAGAGLVVAGFIFTVENVLVISLRQTLVPTALLGRVTSVYRLIAVGVMPLGALAGGFIARSLGLAAPFWIAGAAMVLLGVVVGPVLVRWSRVSGRPGAERDGGEGRGSS